MVAGGPHAAERVVAAAAPLPVQLEPRVGGGVLVRVMLLVCLLHVHDRPTSLRLVIEAASPRNASAPPATYARTDAFAGATGGTPGTRGGPVLCHLARCGGASLPLPAGGGCGEESRPKLARGGGYVPVGPEEVMDWGEVGNLVGPQPWASGDLQRSVAAEGPGEPSEEAIVRVQPRKDAPPACLPMQSALRGTDGYLVAGLVVFMLLVEGRARTLGGEEG